MSNGCESPRKLNAGTNSGNAIFATTAAGAPAAENHRMPCGPTLPCFRRLRNHVISPDNSRGLLLGLTAQRSDDQIVKFGRKSLVLIRFAGVTVCRRLLRALHQ